jgi:hypothetical protein
MLFDGLARSIAAIVFPNAKRPRKGCFSSIVEYYFYRPRGRVPFRAAFERRLRKTILLLVSTFDTAKHARQRAAVKPMLRFLNLSQGESVLAASELPSLE